jgi:hypothetical protein
MSNPFSKYSTETKVVKIKELDAEVTIRALTIGESDMFATMMIGEEVNGKVSFNYKAMAEIRKRKVALAMVSPVMTYEEIDALPSEGVAAINEIADAIEEFNGKGKKKS